VLTPAERESFRQGVGRGLVEAVGEIAALRDPGTREEAAGRFLPAAILEDHDLLFESLEIVAGAPQGQLILAGMSVAAPTPAAVGARVRLEELADPPPGLGRLSVEQAWQLVEEGPFHALVLLCSREGDGGRQLLSFTVETPLSGGAVKDGLVSGMKEGRRLAKRLSGSVPDGVTLVPLDPAEAAAGVVAAATQGARTGYAPSEDGLVALTIFLRAYGLEDADAIVQALELGESLADRVDELEAEAKGAAIKGLAGEAEAWFREQGLDPARVEAGMFAVGLMGEFRAFHLETDLLGWSAGELDELLLDWVPHELTLSDDEVAEFPGSLVDAFAFLGATGRLTERDASALARRVEQRAEEFAAVMADPPAAGPAAALVAAMRADGVDVTDQEAIDAWLEDFNARPREERDRILGPALDRAASRAQSGPRPRPKARVKRKAQRQARRKNRGR
jgi:hypothetical protein